MNDQQNAASVTDAGVIDYHRTVEAFEEALHTKLRNHGLEQDFLSLWVPDGDTEFSILSMIDAAQAGGFQAIAVRIRRDTLGEAALASLLDRIGEIGTVQVEPDAHDTRLIRVVGLKAFDSVRRLSAETTARAADRSVAAATTGTAASAATGGVLATALAEVERVQAAGSDQAEVTIAGATDPATVNALCEALGDLGRVTRSSNGLRVTDLRASVPFAGVQPTFRRALQAAAAAIEREGDAATDRETALRLVAEEDGLQLSVVIERRNHRIRQARHFGGTLLQRAVLDVFCRVIEGLPIQDASDYGGFKLLAALRAKDRARPVAGIMMTVNTDPVLHQPVWLIRRLREDYAVIAGLADTANFFEAPPAPEWVKLSQEERIGRIAESLVEFNRANQLPDDSVMLLRLTENKFHFPIRVWIGFVAEVAYARRPMLTQAVERWLKCTVEDKIQVFNEEYKDKSPLRRLGDTEKVQESKARKQARGGNSAA